MREIKCPLCDQPTDEIRMGSLYGHEVCGLCRNGLMIRRACAFSIDFLLITLLVSVAEVLYMIVTEVTNYHHSFADWFAKLSYALGYMLFVNSLAHFMLLPRLFWDWGNHSYFVWLLVLIVIRFVILPFILAARDAIGGRSLGKRLMGLLTIDTRSGQPIGWLKSIHRNLWLMLPMVCWVVLWQLRKGDRLGDHASRTRVIDRHRVYDDSFRCPECHYDLTGNTTGQCPECGAPVSERQIRID